MKFKALLFALAGAVMLSGCNSSAPEQTAAAKPAAKAPAKSAAKAPAKPQKYDARTTNNKINALLNVSAGRDIQKIRAMIADYRKDTKFGADALYTFDLIEAGLNAKGNPKAIKLPKTPEGMNANAVSNAFFSTAKVFMHLRDYPIAQFFGTVRQKEAPVYVCKAVALAPKDVTGWETTEIDAPVATGFEKYNEKAAALLINDVNSVRDSATLKSDKNCPVSFRVAADKYGISIYIKAATTKQDEIFSGLAYGGMYEMYLQPGQGEFYYQWLYYVNPEKCNEAEWMTPGKHYRFLKEYMEYDSKAVEGGIGTVFFIPWTTLYDRLPDAKSEWKLGVVPWVAEGGFTWGSGQVHELNKFGTLKFAGLEKIMPDIKRQLVMAAWGKYKKESGAVLTFWNDEQRGDRKFEAEVVIPLRDKCTEWGKLVKADMDAATVEMLFKEAVPVWNEFQFVVDDLRTQYLQKQLLSE